MLATIGNGSDGIVATTATNNTANGNGGAGIYAFGTVLNNTASGNTSVGLNLGSQAGYANNVLNGNNGGNANAQVSGGIQMGTNICRGGITCL